MFVSFPINRSTTPLPSLCMWYPILMGQFKECLTSSDTVVCQMIKKPKREETHHNKILKPF